jgi:hypothetical protein
VTEVAGDFLADVDVVWKLDRLFELRPAVEEVIDRRANGGTGGRKDAADVSG